MELEVMEIRLPSTVAGSGGQQRHGPQAPAHLQPRHPSLQIDSAGDYIRQWVPELRHVNTKDLLSGEISLKAGLSRTTGGSQEAGEVQGFARFDPRLMVQAGSFSGTTHL